MKTLEGHDAFPYIAWTVVLSFALFTYSLLSDIKETTAYLEANAQQTETAMNEFVHIKKLQDQKITITKDTR